MNELARLFDACGECRLEIGGPEKYKVLSDHEISLVVDALESIGRLERENVQMRAERDEARKYAENLYNEVSGNSRVVRCAFCGEAYSEGTPATQDQALTDHIKVCPDHPMREVERQLAAANEIITAANLFRDRILALFPGKCMKEVLEYLPVLIQEHADRWDSIDLTGLEIFHLAQFAGYEIKNEDDPDLAETPYTVCSCPQEGVREDENSPPKWYPHIVFMSEYPEEGSNPLGLEIEEPQS